MSNKEQLYDFLDRNRFMTLATSSHDGKPEAATVEYVMDGDELLVNTYVYYRKYQNIIDNPKVACVVTDGEDYTLQFDADIYQLEGQEAEQAKQKMIEKEPDFANFFNDSDTKFFRIKPYWMRLRDYTKDELKEIVWEQ